MNKGIYGIFNKKNGKKYYGSSSNIERRWIMHKRQLRNNNHHNLFLQRAWNKYGEDEFNFKIVEIYSGSSEQELFQLEQIYLDTCPEYNIGKNASGGDNLTKNPNKKLIIENITSSIHKRMSSMTAEEKKKKFSKPLEKNPNWKGGKSFFYCKCGQKIGYGIKLCHKCICRKGDKNAFFGKKHSQKTKEILSQKRTGTYYGKQNKPIKIDGISYPSLGQASKNLDISILTIRWRVLSKNIKFKNYYYI